MTSSTLKIIACLTMLVDHIGATLFPGEIIFRIIGRIAFPIFAFLIVEGYFRTKNVKKYLLRLSLFALVSEIPFDLAFNGSMLEFHSQNVFFTLAITLLAIIIYDKLKESNKVLGIICVVLLSFFNQMIGADYGMFGIGIIFVFYLYRTQKVRLFVALLIIDVVMCSLYTLMIQEVNPWSFIQIFELIALLFIFKFNEKKGLSLRYLFYIFYPGHLLLLHWISTMI